MNHRSPWRHVVTLVAAVVVIAGSGVALAPAAAAAQIGTLSFNGLTSQEVAFTLTTSGGCPSTPTSATNFLIKLEGGNIPSPSAAPNLTGNTSGSTLSGGINAGAFTALSSKTLVAFASSNGLAKLGDGAYTATLVCRIALAAASLGDYVGTFTISNNGATVTPSVPVTAATTATTLTTSPASSATVGDSVTLTATVANTTAPGTVPTGTVQFKTAEGNLGSPAVVNGSGVATLTTSSLPQGSLSLTAAYVPGSASFNPSTSPAAAFTVNPAAPPAVTSTVVIAGPPSSPTFGQQVAISATVSNLDVPGTLPKGAVVFKVDGVALGVPVAVVAGVASTQTTGLAVGTRALTAVYQPASSSFVTSTSPGVAIEVFPAATTTSLSTTPSGSGALGSPVTLTAAVANNLASATIPTGQVQFLVDGVASGSPVALSAGGASTSLVLASGDRVLGATYLPSASGSFLGSTSPDVAFSVVVPELTATAVSAPSTAAFGASVPLTATVANLGTPATVPTGKVQFTSDGVNVGAPVDLVAGQAQYTLSSLAVGTRSISAVYLASSFAFATSTGAASVDVTPAVTATALVSNPVGSSGFGSPVTLTATVSNTSSAAVPAGTVQFQVDGVALGSPVALTAGTASLSVAALAQGLRNLTAVYTPSAGSFTASTSAIVGFTVNASVPTVVRPTVLTGLARVGYVLTCSRGEFTNASTYSYEFLRNGVSVQFSSTVATRKMGASDVGVAFACRVIAASAGGALSSSTSAGLRVAAGKASVVKTRAAILGKRYVGQRLTAYRGVWSPAPTAYKYVWKRGAKIVSRGSFYKATRADRGKLVVLYVYAVRTGYLTGVSSSLAVRVR